MIGVKRYRPLSNPGLDRARQTDLSHMVLKRLLYTEYGMQEKDVDLEFQKGGKPYLKSTPHIGVGITHCRGLVAAAAGEGELGLDAERIRPHDPRVARRVCSDEELRRIENSGDKDREFFRLWVLKESYGKALGVGIGYGMKNAVFRWTGNRVTSNLEGWSFFLFEEIDGYILAQCRSKKRDAEGII